MSGIIVDGEIVDDAPPRPSALIESLRAVGYDLATAIADLIDNSIAASARRVHVTFDWHGASSSIVIRDDGKGMTEAILLQAMRLGSSSPRDQRTAQDMGRFGLGLKTASFSQCRVVAVRTKTAGSAELTRCWDLDLVERTDRWYVRRVLPADTAAPHSELKSQSSGTEVIWTRLDRVVAGNDATDSASRDAFYRHAEAVCRHLQITFSDYIRTSELAILVNGQPLKPWDPFLERHPATQEIGIESLAISASRARVSAFVLPHFSKLSSSEYDIAAGPDGWQASQGFYVYRNRRLLVAADWLGLGFRKERHHELARIRIDISNTTDDEWALDIKKSRAAPPLAIRADLKRIAKATRARASEVYKHRGARLIPSTSSQKTFLWVPSRRHGKTFYRLDREHPVLRAVEGACDEPDVFAALLRLLEETVPTPLIAANVVEEPREQAAPFEGVSATEILKTMRAAYHAMREIGQTHEEAMRRLAFIEPFDRFPELVATFKASD